MKKRGASIFSVEISSPSPVLREKATTPFSFKTFEIFSSVFSNASCEAWSKTAFAKKPSNLPSHSFFGSSLKSNSLVSKPSSESFSNASGITSVQTTLNPFEEKYRASRPEAEPISRIVPPSGMLVENESIHSLNSPLTSGTVLSIILIKIISVSFYCFILLVFHKIYFAFCESFSPENMFRKNSSILASSKPLSSILVRREGFEPS